MNIEFQHPYTKSKCHEVALDGRNTRCGRRVEGRRDVSEVRRPVNCRNCHRVSNVRSVRRQRRWNLGEECYLLQCEDGSFRYWRRYHATIISPAVAAAMLAAFEEALAERRESA